MPGLTEACGKSQKEKTDSLTNYLEGLSEPDCDGALTHESTNGESLNTIAQHGVLREEVCDRKQSEHIEGQAI